MKVVVIPVRADNYSYLLIDEPSKQAAAVDPYDVPKVIGAAKKHGVNIVAAITTHYHDDHSGGNKEFAKIFPNAVIYGGSGMTLPCIRTKALKFLKLSQTELPVLLTDEIPDGAMSSPIFTTNYTSTANYDSKASIILAGAHLKNPKRQNSYGTQGIQENTGGVSKRERTSSNDTRPQGLRAEKGNRLGGLTIRGSDRVPAMTKLIRDKDIFKIGENISVRCMATPCHTTDSICFHATDIACSSPGGVFTGDTLFIAGCGKFFEGTGEDMHAALTYLATLPDDTITYVGHEYTKSNVTFATSVDPANEALKKLQNTTRTTAITTGISTIGDEKAWNLFMRLDTAPVLSATGAAVASGGVMDSLRTIKNTFRG